MDNDNPARNLTISNPPIGSVMWNFLVTCREVILPYLTSEVHNGESVHFWKDSWNGFPPVSSIQDLSPIEQVYSVLWGRKLKDYIDNTNPISGKVTWKDCSSPLLSPNQRNMWVKSQNFVTLSAKKVIMRKLLLASTF